MNLPTPLGRLTETERHFEIIAFRDRYKTPCTLQQSSIFDDAHAHQPGATAIWLGVDRQADAKHDGMFDAANQTRMHLDRKQVQSLIAVLEVWLKCGSFAEDKPATALEPASDGENGSLQTKKDQQ